MHACRNFMTRRDVVLAEGLRTWAVYLHTYPLHPQWDIRLHQQCSSTWFCPLLRPEPRPTRAPYLVALPLLSFAMLSLVVLAARLLVEFHVRYFIGPEYPADLSRTSIVEGCVPFNHSPAPILWWILSKAFLKTMNLIYSEQFHSRVCSMMFLSAKIWSVHPLLFRNSTCSCLSFLSIAVSILLRRILPKSMLEMDKSVIPRQLSQLSPKGCLS